MVGHGGLVIAGGVADHQGVVRRIFRRGPERFLLRANLLAANGHGVLRQIVLFPFALQRFVRRGGNHQHVGPPAQLSRLSRTKGNGGTPRTIWPIAALTAFDHSSVCFRLRVAGLLDFLLQGRVAELRLALHPIQKRRRNVDVDAAGLDLGPSVDPLQRFDQRGKRLMPRLFE